MDIVSPDNGQLASLIVQLRHDRETLFPAGLFDEFGWETLLTLYAAKTAGRAMTIDAVNATTGATAAIGGRWIRYLEESEQLTIDGDTVAMTDVAMRSIETWLTRSIETLTPLAMRIAAGLKTAPPRDAAAG